MTKNPNTTQAPVAQGEPVVPRPQARSAQKKTVETLLADECRWPFGDPLSGDFHFCGARKQDGRPYCEVHTREAFQTAKPRAVVQRPVIA
jgi:GcrA cell cycle regulator